MKESFKEFYEKYWEYREKSGKLHTMKDYYIPDRLKSVMSMIKIQNKNSMVLDVGCGEGTLGMLLREKYKDIYTIGCDISEKSVFLSRGFYDKIYQVDIEKDNLKNIVGEMKYDYIICVEVLEHLIHPEVALLKCKELLSEDGFLIVSFPNIAWWKYRLMLLKGHFPEDTRLYHHAEHLHDFTLHSFTRLLNEVELNIVEIGGEFILPRFLSHLFPNKMIKLYPNLFGHQIVIKTKA
jgi:methionine biosynthesis protein MetW